MSRISHAGFVWRPRLGVHTDAYLQSKLNGPMGVTPLWTVDDAGTPKSDAGARLSPCELVALGQLYLDGGVYNGRRLLPGWWIKESTKATVETDPTRGLGWKLMKPSGFGHTGGGGQHLVVIPDEGLVAARLYDFNAKGSPTSA